MNKQTGLTDAAARERIRTDLGSSLLVEAAAGTGKTTSMVERMIELIRTGTCPDPRGMAAITFTRKAAAEIRARFQSELEKAFRSSKGLEKERLGQALEMIDQLYIGTIHSFCARLLRERPVEAGIDPAFKELDADEDILLRSFAWGLVEDELAGKGHLADLRSAGLNLSDLAPAYRTVTANLDVDEWPAAAAAAPDHNAALKTIDQWADTIAQRLKALADVLPDPPVSDTFEERCHTLLRVHRMLDRSDPLDVMETVRTFARKPSITQGEWRGEKKGSQDLDAKEEIGRWEEFSEEVKERFVIPWQEYRYAIAMKVILAGRDLYERERRVQGVLNYQDLLILSARMLRENRAARHHFQERFTHLLVDEFQDTDPVQAEVMMLLTADDPEETRWFTCTPKPGSLFVVGDPKQSIYRFRRADISTYNRVKEIIREGGDDRVVYLTTNFRSISPIIGWVNEVFNRDGVFTSDPDDRYSPEYVPLVTGREGVDAQLTGVRRIAVGETKGDGPVGVADEPGTVAAIIRGMIDDGVTLPRTDLELDGGLAREADRSDFMIITWTKRSLQEFALRLSQLGIPCETTGGNTFTASKPVGLLLTCLTAVLDPDNPVTLVAALRSPLFGFSDPMLYRFKKAGGRFSFNTPIPAGLPAGESARWADVWDRLKRYAGFINRLPTLTAFRLIGSDMGLTGLAAVGDMGNLEAGNMEKLMEVVRTVEAGAWSTMEIADLLPDIVSGKGEYEGIPAAPHDGGAVRIMNLHKVKGLQAPVVFLSDPSRSRNDVDVHIARGDGGVKGYMTISKAFESGGSTVLAQPPGWKEMEEEEKKFKTAENDRLNYVATTRAGSMMCISHNNVKNMKTSKTFPIKHLVDCEEFTDPGPVDPPRPETYSMDSDTVDRELSQIPARLATLQEPTYKRVYPSKLGRQPEKVHPTGEHGTEWGTVIHDLLEAAMADPGRDLLPLAESLLVEQNLSADHAQEAVESVKSVMNSAIWERATKSRQVLTEIPFKTAGEEEGITRIMSGAIDLVFEEDDGWVIVDYKTGGKDKEKYRPQLEAYRDAWSSLNVGELREIGILWVDGGEYEVL